MIKYVLIFVVFGCCTFIGYICGDYFRRRKKFYFDILSFSKNMQLDINFFENRLKKIVADKKNYNKDFAGLLEAFEKFLNSNEIELTEKLLFNKIWFLSGDEKQLIVSFFNTLGRFNTENQIASLENFNGLFDTYEKKTGEENTKFGSLCFKLGIIFGIMIALILV